MGSVNVVILDELTQVVSRHDEKTVLLSKPKYNLSTIVKLVTQDLEETKFVCQLLWT